MRNLHFIFMSIVLGLLSACSKQPVITPEEALARAERKNVYRLYSTVLADIVAADVTNVVVVSTTVPYPAPSKFGPGDIRDDTLADYFTNNISERALSPRFDTTFTVALISRTSLSDIFGEDVHAGSEQFRKLYPGARGFISLSGVGFSQDGTQALLHVSKHRTALGSGRLYLYEWSRSGWHVAKEMPTWIQ